jgi:hypothetical protein
VRRLRDPYVVVVLVLVAAGVGAGGYALLRDSPGEKFEGCMVAGGAQRIAGGDQLRHAARDWAAGKAGPSGYIEFGSADGLATFADNPYRPRLYSYEVAVIYESDSPVTDREEREFWRRALDNPSSFSAVYLAARPQVADPSDFVDECYEKVNGPIYP